MAKPRAHRKWAADEPIRREPIVFGNPQILEAEIEEVVATLRSGWIGTGPRVARFEDDLRAYLGSPQAVAVHSCTAALHLAMIALDLDPGAEVILPSMTFAATAAAVIHAGGVPVLADVNRSTMCLDPADVGRRITPQTRAILPVHFAGRPCDMTTLLGLAKTHELFVIEDCAHAVEALYQGAPAGTLGDVGAFSFYATKNIVTGEGGLVTTRRQDWADRIRRLASHGLSADAWKRYSDEGFKHYEITEPGFKYNMMDLQAALGLHQLKRVEANLIRRQEIWRQYDQAFVELPVSLPAPEAPNTRHARHLYTLLIDLDALTVGRDQVQQALHMQGIGTGIHYVALHEHRYYKERFGHAPGSLPNATWISERTLSLPLSPKLTDVDVGDIIFAVTQTLNHYAKVHRNLS